MSVVDVSVVDASGHVVPVADNLVQFELTGPGKIIGVGNGDPSSHEPDKASERKAFNGYAQGDRAEAGRDVGVMDLRGHFGGRLNAASVEIKTEKNKNERSAVP